MGSWPPAEKKFYICSDVSHTHTPPQWGRKLRPGHEMKMRVRRKWKRDENENEMKSYLTRTPGGERKRREEGENTNTNTPGPERANPEKAREKKSGGRRAKTNRPAEGGEDRSA